MIGFLWHKVQKEHTALDELKLEVIKKKGKNDKIWMGILIKIDILFRFSSIVQDLQLFLLTQYLKNGRLFEKSIKFKRKVIDIHIRFVAFCLGDQGIYTHQFSKLVTNFVNIWCCYFGSLLWNFIIWSTVLLEQCFCKFSPQTASHCCCKQ